MTHEADQIISLIAQLRDSGTEFCVATIVRTEHATSAKAGAKAVVTGNGEIKGFLGGGCIQGAVRQAAKEVLAEGKPRLIRVKPKDQVITRLDVDGVELHKSSCPSGGTVELFVEPMLLAPHLVVCGASQVAIALADLGARMGYRVTACATDEDVGLFHDVGHVHAGFDLRPLEIEESTFIVVSTQGKRDREALTAALTSDAGYVAFVGSRRKAETMVAQLGAHGMKADKMARLSAPAGLDIHAIEPVEIALSILGEIVAIRRKAAKDPGATWTTMSDQASKI